MRLPQPLPPPLSSCPPRSQRAVKGTFTAAGLCTSPMQIPGPPAVSAGSWTHKSLPRQMQSTQPLCVALYLQGRVFISSPLKKKLKGNLLL